MSVGEMLVASRLVFAVVNLCGVFVYYFVNRVKIPYILLQNFPIGL